MIAILARFGIMVNDINIKSQNGFPVHYPQDKRLNMLVLLESILNVQFSE